MAGFAPAGLFVFEADRREIGAQIEMDRRIDRVEREVFIVGNARLVHVLSMILPARGYFITTGGEFLGCSTRMRLWEAGRNVARCSQPFGLGDAIPSGWKMAGWQN